MGERRAIGKTRRGLGTLFLSFLLTLQVSLAFFPVQAAASGDGIQIVICGAGGMRTVTYDPTDGTITEGSGEEVVTKCPFCIIGLAAFTEAPECLPVALDRKPSEIGRSTAFDLPDDLRHQRPNAIRAPPASL
ncbi:hypothetical protein [Thalassovita mangrovi]|uniref:DUF2946 domain-containing protein n=1 Tax=Thalassovita mangrovi TaxID=2692236 RepID=A0A6L8LF14_9RHOB|nr:hypothetical protein [Thalassovita mangrovi]MYM54405.1 hypothetical protein [Thalassovita mangrovi]